MATPIKGLFMFCVLFCQWSKCVGNLAPWEGQEGRGHGARSEMGTLGTCARHDSWCLGQMLIAMETPVLPMSDINLALASQTKQGKPDKQNSKDTKRVN